MSETSGKNLRLRIKLKTGEEFEAEGDLVFISEQKQEFYRLTDYKPAPQSQQRQQPSQTQYQPAPVNEDISNTPSYLKRGLNDNSLNLSLPRHSYPTIHTPPPQNPRFSRIAHKNDEEASADIKGLPKPVLLPNQEVWDKAALYNGSTVVLRQKYKNVNTSEAALIILGAAKILKDISSMTALELSKSLKLSGYLKDGERLDRALAQELKDSCLFFEGSKRNRSYIITQKGLAKAFTTAERALL